ncbi:MAG: hypothetical protein ACKVS9_12405 [Phycisphaerae bacterium]
MHECRALSLGACRASKSRITVVAAVALGPLLVGCPDRDRIDAPVSARQAMERIHANYARIPSPLQCDATVSFSFLDDQKVKRRFIAHPATIIFGPPRCLYFDVKATLGGSVARLGSSDDRYWLWLDTPDYRKLFWGTWEALEESRARPLAIPPDQLLDVLMLRTLPDLVGGGMRPLLRRDAKADDRLLFTEIDDDGWPRLQREVILNTQSPYLPARIVDRDAAGRVRMDATIEQYSKIEGGEGYIARRYVIDWPLDDATLRIDFSRVKLRTSPLLGVCEFPRAWNGEVELLDEPVLNGAGADE